MEFINKKGPFLKSKDNTKKIMLNLLIALLPIVLFAIYKNGYIPFKEGKTNVFGLLYPLIFILVGTLSTFVTEFVYCKLFLKDKKDYFKNSYALIPGLFLSLIMPINTPLVLLIFGGFISTILGKMLFGGFGNNVFNPALIGRLFIITCYTNIMSKSGIYLNSYELDAISTATPLANLMGVTGKLTYESVVAPYGSLFDFFLGTIPGAVGETSALFCLIGFIYLTITKTIKWRIPVTYISTVFLLTLGIGIINGAGIWYPLFHILSGGLMLGSIFMATDPVTSPTTKSGQVIYGIGLGLLTVFIRIFTNYPEGVLTSILTMNMLVFIMDSIGSGKKLKKNIMYLFLVLCGIGICLGTINKYVETVEVDKNFNVVDVKENGNEYIYSVTQKGFSGLIEANVTIKDSKIIDVEITKVSDSFYDKIEEANYVDSLRGNSEDIEKVDTVSGVTISSKAIKTMLLNTLKDYGEKYE